jgi:geranylgeranylglycerol-phosphate geranylgeranyltransferase
MNWKAWLKLARIEHAFMVLVAIIISEALTAKYAGSQFQISLSSLFPAIGPFFIAAAAFILNDYFGYETDKANKRLDRPLVAKLIKKHDALKAAYFLFALGLVFSFFVNFYCFSVALIFAFLSAIYDNYLKKRPLLGNAFIASSMSISFIYGNLTITPVLQEIILLFVAISFLAGMGRELIITLRDVLGDRKIGATTLPMLLGKKNTLQLASIFFLAAIILSWIPIRGNYFSPYSFLILINNLLLIYCIFLLFRNANEGNFKTARDCSLFAMLIGLIAFGSLAIR